MHRGIQTLRCEKGTGYLGFGSCRNRILCASFFFLLLYECMRVLCKNISTHVRTRSNACQLRYQNEYSRFHTCFLSFFFNLFLSSLIHPCFLIPAGNECSISVFSGYIMPKPKWEVCPILYHRTEFLRAARVSGRAARKMNHGMDEYVCTVALNDSFPRPVFRVCFPRTCIFFRDVR